jgi:two-component system, chemotaxis family, protein-glutamate methylesterase/glutaminase
VTSCRTEQQPWIVAIGASGSQGLDDLQELLKHLPITLPAVVMVVIHRSWNHKSHLRAVLAHDAALPIVIALHGARLAPGTVYIGEPSEHLTLGSQQCGELIDDPYRCHGNRTIDLLFKSVAAQADARMIGVILSGTLDDGSRGLAAIHQAGGITMVRTPSRGFWMGMPENAIDFADPIDFIGDLRSIAQGICEVCHNPLAIAEKVLATLA